MDEQINSNDMVIKINILFDSECINDTRNTMW